MSIIETRYFINGVEIRPVNADEIGFKMDFTKGWAEAELTIDSIVLANEAKQMVINHSQSLGFHEGLPLTVEVGGVTLEYYIDLTDNPLFSGVGDSTIEVKIKRRKAINWFRQQADGLSFEVINKANTINTIDVPYLIIKDNQLEVLLTLSISTFTLTKALIEGVQDVVTATTELIAAATPNAGVPPSFNTGAIINAAIKLAARLVYVVALQIALIKLSKQILELIFPIKRFLKATKVLELMNKGCAKLGYTFSSTLLNEFSQLTILPVPLRKENKSIFTNLLTLDNGNYTKGYPTANDSVSTLGSLLTFLENWSQSNFRIIDNVVHLETDDFWASQSGVTITNTLNLQDARENQWTYNTGESWKRYYCHYQTDVSDIHSLDKIEATDCEYSTEPITTVNADLSTIKGLVDISYPFAFGIPKKELTIVEKACVPFASLADDVINFFGGDSNLQANVKGRIGVVQISKQHYTQTKLIYTTGGKQALNFDKIIGANAIYQKFHKGNQVKENFKRIYNAIIPFSTSNFEALLNNNFIQDMQGNSLKISTFAFINESKSAEIQYSIDSDEAFNVKTIAINV
jgi:hypothetical protein